MGPIRAAVHPCGDRLAGKFSDHYRRQRDRVSVPAERLMAQRKQAEAEEAGALADWWGDGRARFFNPPRGSWTSSG